MSNIPPTIKGFYIETAAPFEFYEIDLANAGDEALIELSKEGGLALNLEEMKRIQSYFKKKRRNPTDVELQSLGQAWSEHCCYKSSKFILKKFIFDINTDDVIDRGDAGVMQFDDEHAYALRIESHNHPSAIGPYGGAATGIGGIVRDVLCMGAQPIALIDPLFFGPLDYPYEKLPHGVKHPKYLFAGVVDGIRDYGNRIGIPTVSGGVYFDEGYVGNCIVNVGCIGIAKKEDILKNSVKDIGDVFILVGGKTGRDGIHGVTFASTILTEESEEKSMGAVQLGDPITKEPLIHACLEAGQRKLLNGMKDLGGGGLSCVIGELALAGGFGAEVDLSNVPLKEEGLAPWEIWVSESQERMMLAVDERNVDEVLQIFKMYDVLATVVGEVIKPKIVRIHFHGIKIFEMDLEFLTKGPEYCRPYKILSKEKKERMPMEVSEVNNYNKRLLKLLSSPNISSKGWVIRQYDHEVRGATVIKPLQGIIGCNTHGDASVIKPLEDSYRGLGICIGTNPWFTAIDPFRGGASIVDEVCRNLVSVGAKPHALTDCLNFGNPEKPECLGEFYEASRGISFVASHFNLPIPSGNVSFYNETPFAAVPPTPVVLGVGIVPDIRKCVTVDLKEEGNELYLIGSTKDEMGGSAYYRTFGGYSSNVPNVDLEILGNGIKGIVSSIGEGCIASCHDLSEGGLGVCLAEMCIGGNLGVEVDISKIGKLRSDVKLFSESDSRWIVEVKKGMEDDFLKRLKGTELHRIGEVGGSNVVITDQASLISLPLEETKKAWSDTIWDLMG
jgi:phosphoribosylformylglycinamidine synthase